jgi:hypothetical protein
MKYSISASISLTFLGLTACNAGLPSRSNANTGATAIPKNDTNTGATAIPKNDTNTGATASADNLCNTKLQSVSTTIPDSSVALSLSTTKDGQEQLQWPNPQQDVVVIAAHRAKGPADSKGMIEICPRGTVLTSAKEAVSLGDIQKPLELTAGYYAIRVSFQAGMGAMGATSNLVVVQIK